MPSQAQQSNAISRFKDSITSVSKIIPDGIANIDRLVDLGILKENPDATGSLLPGDVANIDPAAFAGDNDHLNPTKLAAAATLTRQAAGLVGSAANRPVLSAIPR